MEKILDFLMNTPPEPETLSRVERWWENHTQVGRRFSLPVERALAGGFSADRPGFAFASGYTESLSRLVPELGVTKAALCATEEKGAHPRSIHTRLEAEPHNGTVLH